MHGWLRRATAAGWARGHIALVAMLGAAAFAACTPPNLATTVPAGSPRPTATPILPTATAVPATVTPDLAATATMVAFWVVGTPGPTPSPGQAPQPSATPPALGTAEITQRYNAALDLTEQAIAGTLPTASPIPGMSPEKAAGEQAHDLWYRASSTAVAIFPPPPEYDPLSLNTPDPPHTPWPTAVIPQRALGDGTLYETINTGPPCNTIRDENFWAGQVAGVKIDLCAGHIPSVRSNAGAFIVCTRTGDLENPSHCTSYYPPPELGSVQIIDMHGTQVVLQSAVGTQLVFDLTTGQWVSGTPGPSSTPGISPLPSATP